MSSEHRPLALVNCTIVAMDDGSIKPSSTILIDEGRIVGILQGNPHPRAEGYEVINVDGLWALPGLIDLHTHICEEPDPCLTNRFQFNEEDYVSGIRTARNLRTCLEAGVTLVRDVGSYEARALGAKRAIEAHVIRGPRILSCGKLLTYPNGHFCTRGREVRGFEQVRAAVREEAERGADFIKAASDPEDDEAQRTPCFSQEELSALVDEAHSLGLKVACHTFPSMQGLDMALQAGVDTLEHAVPLADDLLNRMILSGATIVPTFVAAYDLIPESTLLAETQLDPGFARIWNATNFLKQAQPDGCPPSISKWFSYLLRYLPVAIESGVNIGIGTDAGLEGTGFRSAPREIYFLTRLGASNLQALQSATIVGARAIGLESKLGLIAPGFWADLVFMPANPLYNIEALLDVRMVVVDGQIVIDRRL